MTKVIVVTEQDSVVRMYVGDPTVNGMDQAGQFRTAQPIEPTALANLSVELSNVLGWTTPDVPAKRGPGRPRKALAAPQAQGALELEAPAPSKRGKHPKTKGNHTRVGNGKVPALSDTQLERLRHHQQRIVEYIARNEMATAQDIAKIVGYSVEPARVWLRYLVNEGTLSMSIESGPNGYGKTMIFRLADAIASPATGQPEVTNS